MCFVSLWSLSEFLWCIYSFSSGLFFWFGVRHLRFTPCQWSNTEGYWQNVPPSNHYKAWISCMIIGMGCISKHILTLPRKQGSWGQHGAHLGPVGPIWAPCWPHEPCYQGEYYLRICTGEVDDYLTLYVCTSLFWLVAQQYNFITTCFSIKCIIMSNNGQGGRASQHVERFQIRRLL